VVGISLHFLSWAATSEKRVLVKVRGFFMSETLRQGR
jgi:hypothetical protein